MTTPANLTSTEREQIHRVLHHTDQVLVTTSGAVGNLLDHLTGHPELAREHAQAALDAVNGLLSLSLSVRALNQALGAPPAAQDRTETWLSGR